MDDSLTLAEELSELFREDVSVGAITQREFAGASIAVTIMSYRTSSHSSSGGSNRKYYEQTAVVLDDDQLYVPEFSLSPSIKGLAGKMMKVIAGNFGAIEFSDTPEFSENYWLHGWAQEPVRVLFTKAIRNHFAKNSGWSVRGKRNRLVIFKSDVVCDEAEIDAFIQQSLVILALFQEGEEALDERPQIHRDVRPEDISETAAQMGGFAGALLQKQLRKISVTGDELQSFIASPPPRDIPPGMHRQVVGDNLPLVFLGTFFFVGGIFGGTLWVLLADGVFKLLGLPFLLIFPIVGFLMAYLTLRHRKRKTRTLREGTLASGVVTDVNKTGTSINNQLRFHVGVKYIHEGREQKAIYNAYGSSVDQARALKDSGQETRLLVDPEDASHVVCLDMLIILQ